MDRIQAFIHTLTGMLGLSGGAPSVVLGVDIGSSAIKVVELKAKKGVAALSTYGSIALGLYGGRALGRATDLPPEKIAEALGDVLREANVSTASGGIAIPFSASLTALVPLPDAPYEQLKSMVPVEARKYIPVPMNEVALDWFVLPRREKPKEKRKEHDKGAGGAAAGTVDVLVVAVQNDVLGEYSAVVSGAALSAQFLEVEIFSSMRAVLADATRPVLIVDMGAATTKLYFIDGGVMRSTHLITKGGQDVTGAIARALEVGQTEAEKKKRDHGLSGGGEGRDVSRAALLIIEDILSEMNRVLLNYEKKFDSDIAHVILTGGGAALKGLKETAERQIRTDVAIAHPFSKVEAPAFLDATLEAIGPEFAVSLGLALRGLEERS